MKPVIVLAAYTAGFGVIRALGRQGVPVKLVYHDPGDMERKSKYVKEEIRLPDSLQDEQGYVDGLLSPAVGPEGAVLMPTSDATLAAVSRNKPALTQKFIVACPDWSLTEQFLDKKHTVAVARQAGVPAPKTLLPHSVEEIEAAAPGLMFPLLAKPAQTHLYNRHFQRKMTRPDNLDELIRDFREAESRGVELMVQEFIPGPDALGANYNAYYWEGRPLLEFTAHKVRNAPPEMGSPCVLRSERMDDVIAAGRRLLGAVGFSGFACSEWKCDPRDGVYKLMEVNPRHNMSSYLAVRCGLNFPYLQYRHLAEGVLPARQDFETGVYWIDFYRDWQAWGRRIGKGGLSAREFIAPYLHKHVDAIIDWSDSRPVQARLERMVKKALGVPSLEAS